MPIFNFKAYRPHFIVAIIFTVIISIYFLPLVFQGKTMKVHDIVQYQGMAKEISDMREQYGEEPYWTNSMFSGMPNTLISMKHWGNLIKPIHDNISRFPAYPASLILIGMACFYIMLLAFDVHWLAAVIGAIGFGFSCNTFGSLVAGHNAKVACMMYMPLVIAGMAIAYRKNWLLGASVFGIGIALQIANNHVQITYYLFFIGFVYFVVELLNALKSGVIRHFLKTTAGLSLAAILALGTHAGYFLSVQEYSKYTIRGENILKPLKENKESTRADGLDRDYVFNYSYSLDEPFTFIMADYYGGESGLAPKKYKNVSAAMRKQGYDPNQILGSLPAYFGSQPFVAGPMYMGCIIVFLFILGMVVVKSPIKWALFAASLVGILLAYGKNLPQLNYFLFDHFPIYNKFRSVTMAVILPQFCLSMLAVLGIQELIDAKKKEEYIKPLLTALAIIGGILTLVFVTAGSVNYLSEQELSMKLPDWLLEAISDDRKAMRTGDALRAFVLIGLVGGILYF